MTDTLPQLVDQLLKKYDESPDDMAGFEIRIKRPVQFRKELFDLLNTSMSDTLQANNYG